MQTIKYYLNLVDYNDNPLTSLQTDIVNECIELLCKFSMEDLISHSVTGRRSFQFDYRKDGIYIELEIFPDRLSYLFMENYNVSDEQIFDITDYKHSLNYFIENIWSIL